MLEINRHKSNTHRSTGKWLVLISILLCELMFYTWVRVESTQTVFRISKARHDQKESMSYNEALALEKATLISPERISGIARSSLNLSVPRPDQIIYIFGDDL